MTAPDDGVRYCWEGPGKWLPTEPASPRWEGDCQLIDGDAVCRISGVDQVIARGLRDHSVIERDEYTDEDESGNEIVLPGRLCALTTDGQVLCWNDPETKPGVPVASPLRTASRYVTIVGAEGGCGLTATGSIDCGLLYPDLSNLRQLSPPTGRSWISLAGDDNGLCALDSAGVVNCGPVFWGYQERITTEASGIVFGSIDRSVDLFCGLDESGAAWCWGYESRLFFDPYPYAAYEDSGAFGDGNLDPQTYPDRPPPRTAPGPVAGGHRFTSLHVDRFRVCGVTATNELWCWGHFAGPDGTTPTPTPVRIL